MAEDGQSTLDPQVQMAMEYMNETLASRNLNGVYSVLTGQGGVTGWNWSSWMPSIVQSSDSRARTLRTGFIMGLLSQIDSVMGQLNVTHDDIRGLSAQFPDYAESLRGETRDGKSTLDYFRSLQD